MSPAVLRSFARELTKIALRRSSASPFAQQTAAQFAARDKRHNEMLADIQAGYDKRTGRSHSELLTYDEDSNLYRPAMLIPEQPEIITRM